MLQNPHRREHTERQAQRAAERSPAAQDGGRQAWSHRAAENASHQSNDNGRCRAQRDNEHLQKNCVHVYSRPAPRPLARRGAGGSAKRTLRFPGAALRRRRLRGK